MYDLFILSHTTLRLLISSISKTQNDSLYEEKKKIHTHQIIASIDIS